MVDPVVKAVARSVTHGTPDAPYFGVVYGGADLSKTTATVAAFPRALHVGLRGHLRPAVTYLGLHPSLGVPAIKTAYVRTVRELTALAPQAKDKGFAAIHADDLSLLLDGEMDLLHREYADARNRYAKWMALLDKVKHYRRLCRELGLHAPSNMHEREGFIDPETGEWIRGGPRLPSKKRADELVKWMDFVGRIVDDPARPGRTPAARAAFDCRYDPDNWHGKDRHSVAPLRGPANLWALLTRAGYVLERARGLEWQNELARKVQEKVDSGSPPAVVATEVAAKVLAGGKYHAPHVLWAIRDGLALAELNRLMPLAGPSRFLADMFDGPAVPAGAPHAARPVASGSGGSGTLDDDEDGGNINSSAVASGGDSPAAAGSERDALSAQPMVPVEESGLL